MNKRLVMLEKMTSSGQADSFAWYALALEYKSAGRAVEALKTFEVLRANDPDYLPMYLMAGQMLLEDGQPDRAKPWLELGAELAARQGDAKALGEIRAALDDCG